MSDSMRSNSSSFRSSLFSLGNSSSNLLISSSLSLRVALGYLVMFKSLLSLA